MALLNVEHLSKLFGQTRAVDDVSFSLEEGKTLAVIGTSGSGKTTLLRMLVNLETPTSGVITVGDRRVFDAGMQHSQTEKEIRENRRLFGMVFQSFNLFPQYTALENVTLARRLNAHQTGESRESIENDGIELLDMMGLKSRMHFYPQQLSGGQQQRVAIARALSLKPKILCFDEPTSALDPELTGEVLRVIRSLAMNKTTMIIVTHEMEFARDVSDTTLFMENGKVVERGPSSVVFNNPQEARTREFLRKFLTR